MTGRRPRRSLLRHPWFGRLRRGDTGAGGVLALAVIGATLSCTLAALAVGSALAMRQRVVAAADAAALAAADALLGATGGEPCALAAEVAAAHRVALSSCRLDGVEARVEVGAEVLGMPIRVRSRAGPPT
ncbi:MAG: helicase [Leifsonia xyli]|nr:MAG: helicase [Leifsonia xyli]